MVFIEHGRMEELTGSDEEKIRKYIEDYRPFFKRRCVETLFDSDLDGIPERKLDRALTMFGNAISIPESNRPKR